MKRWHEEYNRFYREWKAHWRSHVESNLNRQRECDIGVDPFKVDCPCDEQKGRFRKKDAWDCGKTKCGLCHYDKFPKREQTRKEEKSNIDFQEQLKEFMRD